MSIAACPEASNAEKSMGRLPFGSPESAMRCEMQVSDAAVSQQDHMAQAGNSTYLMEPFNKLVHDLEEPLGVSAPLL